MVKEISVNKLYKEYNEDNVEIIDIREREQYSQTNKKIIPGAKLIPFSQLTQNLQKVDFKPKIYVICRHGHSSLQAVRILNAYKESKNCSVIASVEEGYQGWDSELIPISKKTAPTTSD